MNTTPTSYIDWSAYTPMKDYASLLQMLPANGAMDFTDRIYDGGKQAIPWQGGYASHQMSYVTDDNGYGYVYPNIVNDKVAPFKRHPSGLTALTPEFAPQYARSKKQYLKMPANKADWMSKNYKRLWYPPSVPYGQR